MYHFPVCTSIAVSGATCSGKTFWLNRLLCHKNEMFENPPQKCYIAMEYISLSTKKWKKNCHSITFQQGLPSTSDLGALADEKTCNLICLDDLMESVTTSSEMENLFVKVMHHRHCSSNV